MKKEVLLTIGKLILGFVLTGIFIVVFITTGIVGALIFLLIVLIAEKSYKPTNK